MYKIKYIKIRNKIVIAMKNNIRQFWNDLPSSKRLSIINIEKENVLKRLRKYKE